MTYTTNILALPLVLIVWAVDMYLMLMLAYAVTGKLSGERVGQLRTCLGQFIEPVPQAVGHWLGQHTAKPLKQWVSWAIVAFVGLVIRHLLILLIVSVG